MVLLKVVGIFIFLGICLLIVGIIDNHRFRVVEQTIELSGIKKDFRFVLISDLHNHVYGKDNQIVVEKIRAAKPDFVMIAGDLITSRVSESTKPGEELVNAICREFPVYYGMGNHETKMKNYPAFGDTFQRMIQNISNENMHILMNESVYLEDYHVRITGLELPRYFFSKFKTRFFSVDMMNGFVGEADPECCNVLIAHNPDYFPYYAKWGADLVLSGHVHGGIMKLPVLGGVISPSYVLFPKYDGGIYKEGKSTMFLGRGMGAHTLPFRFFNPGELYIVNCLRK